VDLQALLLASAAAFALALLSAVAGFGGGVLLLPVFTALFGLRAAVPMLTLTQIGSNAGRAVLNRAEIRRPVIGWFAAGAVPLSVAGALLLAHAPLSGLKRGLGAFLIAVVIWRRLKPHVGMRRTKAFAAVGAVSGLVSALVGSAGPLTAPFFLAYGLTRGAYIGTEAACALVLHLSKTVAYGGVSLLTPRVVLFGLLLTPATIAGAWVGKKLVDRLDDRVFILLVEAGLVVSGLAYLAGL
jgi:uncharacterized membrane protein YfcA